jgi:succinate-semialdehyde dehydrogenase/glutarate-semialdehyde dehydrogenase
LRRIKRFIAVEAIADEFLEKFTSAISNLKAGDPMDPICKLVSLSERGLKRLIRPS